MSLELPELLLHFSVIFALVAPKLGVKKAFLLSFPAVLPDLDVLFYVHRSMSHSILILLASGAIILLAVRRLKPVYLRLAIIGSLALLSHLILDCFQTYTPILFPLLDTSFWINIEGTVLISPNSFTPQISAGFKEEPTVFKPFEKMDARVFTSEGLLVSIVLVAPTLILSLKPLVSKHYYARRRGKCLNQASS